MKKIIQLIVLILFISSSFAQNNLDINLNWSKPAETRFSSQDLLYFEGASFHSSSGMVPYYTVELNLEKNQIITDLKLVNIIEESIGIDTAVFEFVKHDLSDNYTYHIEYNKENSSANIYISCLRIGNLPYFTNRLNSFSIEYFYSESNKSVEDEIVFPLSSVMNSGQWFEFTLNKSGIYKVTYNQLNEAGIDFSSFSTDQFKMYGFGGMLPEKNNDLPYGDVPEIGLMMFDGGDGSFDNGDYFLFYGQGPDTWKYNPIDNDFSHQLNIYERASFYYFVLSDGQGKRIDTENNSFDADNTINTYIDFQYKEDETYNLINSGRRWFGDKFEFTTDYQYNFPFENISANSTITIRAKLAARSTATSSFNMSALGSSVNESIPAVPTGSYPSYAVDGYAELNINNPGNTNNVLVDLSYNQPLSGSIGWLDNIEVIVERDLIFNGGQLSFRNPEVITNGKVSEFVINNKSAVDPEIWDVTEVTSPKKINYKTSSTLLSFSANAESLTEYIIFDQNNFLSASYVKSLPNQNLHAEINHDYIIISHPDFVTYADELADFHRNESGLDVFVTVPELIYNEYSSGRQDISAIKDFIRSVYVNSDDDKKLKYLLLFGDASMDYLNREVNNTNMVPTWQSYESFDPTKSYATDDFFGFLDVDEGDFLYDEVNIGIGRFPVISEKEASDAVNKIKHYRSSDSNVKSDWRNVITLVADDEDNNTHIRQADELSDLVDTIYSIANLDKIYADAYLQESTPAGQRYSRVNEAINERIDKGTLIMSYTGHGGEVGWGLERFLDIPDIQSWKNYDKLPVFLTATCEFARYDDPDRVSAGEQIFIKGDGGGIALFTTSRATYAGSNFTVSTNFYETALKKVNGEYLRLGDILKLTKILSGTTLNVRKFILLGDPALKMNLPEQNIVINSIVNNGNEIATDTLKALSNITILGEITDSNNEILRNFNGTVFPTIYDKKTVVSTLGNDDTSPVFDFDIQKNILYKGAANVVNGEFEFTFIVPKDIAYKFGNGKISLYARTDDSDAAGYDNEIIIGGFDDFSEDDNSGPEIQLYIDNTNFIDGGLTSENPILLAFVSDENGINTTGNGIGHDISATLDNDQTTMKILNDYYVADVNSYKSGMIEFPFFNVDEGYHTLEFKVWDIHNNSSKASIGFNVASSSSVVLDQLFNYPNPVIDQTTFSFEHNQSGEDLDILVDIYSIDGKRVTRLETNVTANSSRSNDIHWDVTDNGGSKVAKGIYIYKVSVTSTSGNESSQTNRLVVIK